jgi:hypothetical protein
MALTTFPLIAEFDSGVTTITTGSGGMGGGPITPNAARRQFAAVSARNATITAPTSVTGCGLTWTLIPGGGVVGTVCGCWIYQAKGSPTTGQVSAAFGASQAQLRISVWEVAGEAGVRTANVGTVNTLAVTSATVTLGAFADATNGAYGAFGIGISVIPTVGSGFTSIHTVNDVLAVLLTEGKTSQDTTVDCSWVGAAEVAGVAFELLAAGAGGGTPQRTRYRYRNRL